MLYGQVVCPKFVHVSSSSMAPIIIQPTTPAVPSLVKTLVMLHRTGRVYFLFRPCCLASSNAMRSVKLLGVPEKWEAVEAR